MQKIRKLLTTVIAMAVAAMMLTTSAFAYTGEATVNSYMLNMREEANMYSLILDVAYQGNTVYVTQDDGSGWVQVTFNGQTGYMNSLFLDYKEVVAEQVYDGPIPEEVQSSSVVTTGNENASILGDGVFMRSTPSLSGAVLATLYTGTPIRANGIAGDWYQVTYNNQTGYVYIDYVILNDVSVSFTVTEATVNQDADIYSEPTTAQDGQAGQTAPAEAAPAPAETPAPAPTPAPTATPAPVPSSPVGQSVVDIAMQYIGVPYVWGGTSPSGFDCSGLIYYSYKQLGVTINRVAQSMYYDGVAVDTNSLQPGDILLFGSSVYNIWHAGMYIGNGMFIHAAGSGTTVRTQSLSNTYGMRLVAARRIL